MGQKVNPIGLRVGVIRSWDSRWFAKGSQYIDYLHEDYRLRKYIKKKLKHAGVAKIEMERAFNKIKVIISSPYFTTSSSDVVAKQTGVKELTLATSVGAFDSVKDYFGLFDYNIDHLISVLK